MFYDGYLVNKATKSNVMFDLYSRIEGVDLANAKAGGKISRACLSKENGRKKNGTDDKNSKTLKSMFSH